MRLFGYEVIWLCGVLTVLITSCRKDVEVFLPEKEQVAEGEVIDAGDDRETQEGGFKSIRGFYLLNEGNMGSNKATLDYYDYSTGTYTRNIYGEANPNVAKEMGDVGNALAIYGGRMYAVINCSNKIEVMERQTARRIGQVDIPNCRYMRFHEGYMYVTSYAGPVAVGTENQRLGYVAKVDTATLQVVATCLTGYQPDELEIANGRIYVANSGGYLTPNYENTVSVIDLQTFTEEKRISVAKNLHHLRSDGHGQLWVSSRGDYYTEPSKLYCIDLRTETVSDSIDMAVSNFHLDGDSLYIYGASWSYLTMEDKVTYGIVNVKNHQVVTTNFISDGTEQDIQMPYGVAVNPLTKDIYVTDAKNYVNPGWLYCFDREGKLKWKVRTGDIPAHIAFLGELK